MNVFEDLFPGNASVMSKLMAAFDTEGVTAFTGAGTSMPSLPGWSDLISTLVSDALTDGKIDKSTASALQADHGDYLYAVDEIYSFAGKAQTKSKVAKIYRALENPTHAHRLIVGTNFDRMMTLNYDVGLELASAADRAEHIRSIAARNHNERSEWLRHGSDSEIAPVLHWHGLAGDAESIVLSGSDYVEFYDNDPSNKETLREIFKTRRVLMIGFGFADPFIERELNSVMQPLPVANTHFAFIGIRDGSTADIKLERRRYAAKYKLETVFYPIGVTGASPDHSKLADLLQEISSACPRSTKTTEPGSAMQKVKNNLTLVSPSYRSSLFSFGEKQIYCEPNIWYSSIDDGSVKEFKMAFVDLMAAECHANIEAPHEYGLSTLGRRLLGDLTVAGKKAIFREAGSFPKYKRAILADPDFAAINPVDVFTVILDNFLVVEHQRTVRELIGAYENVRIIVLQRKSFAASADESLGELGFRGFRLDGLSRADIRTVVNIVAPTYNSDVTSSIVDKVYADLLQLCIPLTPSNVIMYASGLIPTLGAPV